MADEETFALAGDGLYEVTWDGADAPLWMPLLASPADARGRGMDLSVVRGGEAVDLTGATAYLLWRHREARARGCEPFEAVDAEHGRFRVFWPASMACAEGTVDAQVGGPRRRRGDLFRAVRRARGGCARRRRGLGRRRVLDVPGGDPEVRGGRRADRRCRREGAAGGVRRDRRRYGCGRGGDRGEGGAARGGGARRLRRRAGRRGRRRAGRCRRPGRREPDGEGGADRGRRAHHCDGTLPAPRPRRSRTGRRAMRSRSTTSPRSRWRRCAARRAIRATRSSTPTSRPSSWRPCAGRPGRTVPTVPTVRTASARRCSSSATPRMRASRSRSGTTGTRRRA